MAGPHSPQTPARHRGSSPRKAELKVLCRSTPAAAAHHQHERRRPSAAAGSADRRSPRPQGRLLGHLDQRRVIQRPHRDRVAEQPSLLGGLAPRPDRQSSSNGAFGRPFAVRSSSARCCQTSTPIISSTVMPASGNDWRRRSSEPHGRAPVLLFRFPVATPNSVTRKNSQHRQRRALACHTPASQPPGTWHDPQPCRPPPPTS
jgi:hypothetical protein